VRRERFFAEFLGKPASLLHLDFFRCALKKTRIERRGVTDRSDCLIGVTKEFFAKEKFERVRIDVIDFGCSQAVRALKARLCERFLTRIVFEIYFADTIPSFELLRCSVVSRLPTSAIKLATPAEH